MNSKLGPHVLAGTPELTQFIKAGSKIIKLVDSSVSQDWYHPDLFIIGRKWSPFDAQSQYESGISAYQAAEIFIDSQRAHYQANHLIKNWEGHNEPVWGGPNDPESIGKMRWYADFEVRRMQLLADMGLWAVIGNFSTGYPEVESNDAMWEAFLPALLHARHNNGVLGLHEYGGPFMWSGWGPFASAQNCGQFSTDDDTGWLTLRYRKVHGVLDEHGIGDLPIAITECGLDRVRTWCPPLISGPWKSLISIWVEWEGSTDPIEYWRGEERDPERYYAEQLIWYDKQLQQDDYLVGATIFTVGHHDPTWEHHEIAGTRVSQYLIDYIKQPQPEPPAPPAPGPPAGNLLRNASFEDGYYHHNNTSELAIPNGWDFWFASETTEKLERQDSPWGRPEVVVWHISGAPAGEEGFWRDGEYTLKVFGAWRPIRWALSQKVHGLIPGHTYDIAFPIFPDLVMGYKQGKKVFADDPLAGEHRIYMDQEPEDGTGWLDGILVRFGQWSIINLQFEAVRTSHEVTLEVRGRWGIENNGWFVDLPELIDLDAEEEPMYDLLNYIWADGRKSWNLRRRNAQGVSISEEFVQVQAGIRDREFFHAKGSDIGNAVWEQFSYDDEFIWRGFDTSDPNGSYRHTDWIENEGARHGSRWAPRLMRVGDTFRRLPFVIHYNHAGIETSARFVGSWIKLAAHHPELQMEDGAIVRDVLELHWLFEKNGNPIEKYFYSQGLKRWEANDGRLSYFNLEFDSSEVSLVRVVPGWMIEKFGKVPEIQMGSITPEPLPPPNNSEAIQKLEEATGLIVQAQLMMNRAKEEIDTVKRLLK